MKEASSLKIAVLVSRFNERVTGALLKGCLERLKALGVREDCIRTAWVPGAFELPFAAMQTARLGSDSRPDAIVCLGAVIRGGTPHFDYVCAECARGIMRVGLSTGVPAIFGVLTCDTLEQALERCGETDASADQTARASHDRPGDAGRNKGAECAEAAVAMGCFRAPAIEIGYNYLENSQ